MDRREQHLSELPDSKRKWIRQVEAYYRDTYPTPMLVKVGKALPIRHDSLTALFDVVINQVSAQYGRVPDVKAIEEAWQVTLDEYPELRAGSYNRQVESDKALLEEDAGWSEAEAREAFEEMKRRVGALAREKSGGQR